MDNYIDGLVQTFTYADGTKRIIRQTLNITGKGKAADGTPATFYGNPNVEDSISGEKLEWVDFNTIRDSEGNQLRLDWNK